jgi:hypothetical protein
METWIPIVNFPDYQVSDDGRVRSRSRGNQWRTLKPIVDRDGYHRVDLCNLGRRSRRGIHVLVAEAFIGPTPEGMEVCHQDGNRSRNIASNLRYDTHAENMKDIRRHRRMRWDVAKLRERTPAELRAVESFRHFEAESKTVRDDLKSWAWSREGS